ncbi:MAG: hypothetical protein KIT84_11840 [Labilithrix sp.]|nr:hypothetical protein [Labilithrix sp.]MCW5811702.1 hypothetical protein [Labilithrix sp.]
MSGRSAPYALVALVLAGCGTFLSIDSSGEDGAEATSGPSALAPSADGGVDAEVYGGSVGAADAAKPKEEDAGSSSGGIVLSDAGSGDASDAGSCTAKSIAALCNGQCDVDRSNCGQTVTCTCATGDTCVNKTCCTPESKDDACKRASAECGVVTNNCGQDVDCGDCDGAPSRCGVAAENKCCRPAVVDCQLHCGESLSNGCEQIICEPCCQPPLICLPEVPQN